AGGGDSAGANEREHGRRPYAELPHVERDRRQRRQDIRDQGIADDLEAAGAAHGDGFERPWFDRLDRFRPQLRDRAGHVKRDAEHAGEGTESDRGDEDQGENEGVDAPQRVQQPARRVIGPDRRGDVASGQYADRDREDGRE